MAALAAPEHAAPGAARSAHRQPGRPARRRSVQVLSSSVQPGAERRRCQAGHTGADEPAGVERRAVERDGVGQPVARHHLGDERLAGRVVDGGREPGEQRDARRPSRAARRRSRRARRAASEDRARAVWVTARMRAWGSGRRSCPPTGRSSRNGRNCSPVTMPRAVEEWSGQLGEDQPVLGDPAHPGADVGDERAGGSRCGSCGCERGEGGAHSAATFVGSSRPGAGCPAPRGSGSATRTDIQASRRRRMSLSRASAVRRQREDHLAAVGGVVGALDEAALDQAGRRCGSCSGR